MKSLALALALALASQASAQSIAGRVAATNDGTVRMAYDAREGLCGDGRNWKYGASDENRDWESVCEPGPVRVSLRVVGGEVTRLRTYVGGRWRARPDAADLGMVPAADAAAYLMTLVQEDEGAVSRDALTAVSIAGGVTFWPDFLDIARDENRPRRLRKHALTLVTMEASRLLADEADPDEDDDPDTRIREQAVFALSQRPSDESVPRLIDLTRHHPSAAIRRRALFWLGQSGDPRAIPVVEEVLRGR